MKRHLAVDSLGFPFFTHCTKANISDDAGLVEMLTINIQYFRNKPLDLLKITILLDIGLLNVVNLLLRILNLTSLKEI